MKRYRCLAMALVSTVSGLTGLTVGGSTAGLVAAGAGPPPGTTAVPPSDPELMLRFPAIDGYSIAPVPADDQLWAFFDSSIPSKFRRHHALVVAADGVPVARLVVAASTGRRPAIDTFVEQVFAQPVFLPVGAETTGDGVVVVANSASPVWTEMEGSAVVVAEQETDGNFQWAWGADDLVWIVRGKRDAEAYVRALLQVHAATLGPYDLQGLIGDLFDYTPTVPGFQYWDLPRMNTVPNLSGNWLGECAERFYLGYILGDGATGAGKRPEDLEIALVKGAGWCVDEGLLADVAADIASLPGAHAEQLGGLTVMVDDHLMIALVGDVLVVLGSAEAQTLIDMRPFIDGYFAGLPR